MLLPRFNGAAAIQPRKSIGDDHNGHEVQARFNGAAAIQPRKSVYFAEHGALAETFNGAAAIQPRKSRASSI